MLPTLLDLSADAPLSLVGGKAHQLAALAQVPGVKVPPGLVLTTAAFAAHLAQLPAPLRAADPSETDALRAAILATPLPAELAAALAAALSARGPAFAVRSSATTEDAPGASAAGLYTTALNVRGEAALHVAIRRCWASLFSPAALAYRHQRPGAQMAVIVQELVAAQAAGVLFTADPLSGHRQRLRIEATFGLGEALIGGQAPADAYTLQGDQITSQTLVAKPTVQVAAPGGGLQSRPLPPDRQSAPTLSPAEIHRLAALGRQIAAHRGQPQDIEWCLVDGEFVFVQSRPITTLYPIPAAPDAAPRIYLSVSHQQMMTDAMRPLGLTFFQQTALRPMVEAGGRLWVDATAPLLHPASRPSLLALFASTDPPLAAALDALLTRGDLFPDLAPALPLPPPAPLLPADPALVQRQIEAGAASLAALDAALADPNGPSVYDRITADLPLLRQRLADPEASAAIFSGMGAAAYLNTHLADWLGETQAADTLCQSAPHNPTAEMGLALLDLADAIRPHPAVVDFLSQPQPDLAALPTLPGGPAVAAALADFLDRYGARCPGEIDLSRPRFRDEPAALVPLLLHHLAHQPPGEGPRRFARGAAAAAALRQSVLDRLAAQPEGEARAAEAAAMIDRLRTYAGLRELPKAQLAARYARYRAALLTAAAPHLSHPDDLFFHRWEELPALLAGRPLDPASLAQRRADHARHAALHPPRALTSQGEAIHGRPPSPTGAALRGIGASAGVVTGRARRCTDPRQARFAPGDILVTPYTDPGWTPLFVSIAGLVTAVGSRLTHGAVIAREYGLPAVVGLDEAMTAIADGQWIRIDGTAGTVELLPEPPQAPGD